MGHSPPCVLGFFLLNTLLYPPLHARDAVLTLEPGWFTFYAGEAVTFICDAQEGEDTDWEYKLNMGDRVYIHYNTHKSYTLQPLMREYSGEYQCFGRHKRSHKIKKSNIVSLTVSEKPMPKLTPGPTTIPVGGNVTLTCSVDGSSGWKYDWFRRTPHETVTQRDADEKGAISVSQGGVYMCRGQRGNPFVYTYASDEVTVEITFSGVVALTLQHNWPQIYSGEAVTLRCEIQGGGGDTEWEYEWRTTNSKKPRNKNEYRIDYASSFHSGNYECRGRIKSVERASTVWSESVSLTVSEKPRPVLTVSPSWLSPGDSVTLSCSVKDPSAGWRFYWYKAVPQQSADNYYSYSSELLPDSTNGTEQDSYIVHGPTHTAGYVCKAGRGDPVYYTYDSEPKFVWSGDFHPSASLTVSPDRVQHFTSDSVSLSCDGNSTEWTVRRFSEKGHLSPCSYWGTMTGSTCIIDVLMVSTVVYWCESGSGEFSNAVNVTGQYNKNSVILVSPVHPVAEGDSVTLVCESGTENALSSVFFYKNDKLIQNNTGRELHIPAVSKSHEGFYKCEGKDSRQWRWMSPESWMSVKRSRPGNSSFRVLLIVGLVCGILLMILLLLLFCYRKSKGSRFIRSQSTNQSSATYDIITQDQTQCNQSASPVHGDDCLYESIKGPGDTENDEPIDVTYSLIELKNFAINGKNNEPHETSVYTDVRIGSAAAAADETVYSEVKPGTAHDQ